MSVRRLTRPTALLSALAMLGASEVIPPDSVPPTVIPPQDQRTDDPSTWPHVTAPEGEQAIRLTSLDLQVEIDGAYARTTQTLVFHNPNGRVLSGELVIPLADRATVCGYALDVGGELVDGVVVAKQRARQIMDTEIRRGVDPGLVEHARGNAFRTRLYPIPAGGSRTVRLVTVEPLARAGTAAAWRYTPPIGQTIDDLNVRIDVLRSTAQPNLSGGFDGLTMAAWEDRWVAELTQTGVSASQPLLVQVPDPGSDAIVRAGQDRHGEAFFSVQAMIGHQELGEATNLTAPARVGLAWDVSGSRTTAQVERDLAVLAALCQTWTNTNVVIQPFADRAYDRHEIAIANGDATALIAHLRAMPRDGGTNLNALDLSRRAASAPDLWLLCSDGLRNLAGALPTIGGVPVHSLTGASTADRDLLRLLARQTGGSFSDLASEDVSQTTTRILGGDVRLVGVDAPDGHIADLQFDPEIVGGTVTVLGRMLVNETTIVLRLAGGGHDPVSIPVTISQSDLTDGDLLASAWAARHVGELGVTADRHGDELLALGQRYGVVSPVTSLLVLETLAQYLEHDVAPPASRGDMLAQWQAAKDAEAKQVANGERNQVEQVVRLWQARAAWWSQNHQVPAGWRFAAGDNTTDDNASRQRRDQGASVGEVEDTAATDAPGEPATAPVVSEAAPSRNAPAASGGFDLFGATAPTAEAASADAAPADRAGGAAGASMQVAAWNPDTPYLRAIAAVPVDQAYTAYLAQRPAHASSPAFFLDCADLLFRSGRHSEAVRVLSNLGELGIDDAALLRVWAWRLAQAHELDQAIELLSAVRTQRPEEVQSHRQVALVLADRYDRDGNPDDAQAAIEGFWQAITQHDERFPEIGVIAATELNRLLAKLDANAHRSQVDTSRLDQRLLQLLDYDLRIVLSWDADLTDVDLHVVEPTGERGYYGHRQTRIGGAVSRDATRGYGPEEYTLRRALPGNYTITAHYYGSSQQNLIGPATVTATVILDYDRATERRQTVTLRLDKPNQRVNFATITIGDDGVIIK